MKPYYSNQPFQPQQTHVVKVPSTNHIQYTPIQESNMKNSGYKDQQKFFIDSTSRR